MRRFALAISMLAAAVLAPATAYAFVGAPITHGPDPGQVGEGPEAPAAPKLSKRMGKLVPSAWCGTETASDDTVNEVDNGRFRYHAVYMLSADAPNRFAALATTMQTDALQASSLLESSYGRAIRFDIGTSCGPSYLDISVVRMTQTSAEMTALARTSNGTFDAVSKTLDDAGFTTIQPRDSLATAAARTRNYLVWLDAPAPAGSCGQAAIYDDPSRAQDNLNNFGGKAAIVFRNGSAAFCSSNAVRHEIGHNLGGLQPVAPHAFDGAHCNDAYEDTMCYSNSPQVGDGGRGEFFDYGNDDYWSLPGAPLAWWTVDENRFLCPDTTCNMVTQSGVEPDVPSPTDLVPQPEPSPTVSPARANRATPPRARLRVRARRYSRGVWRLRLRATGEGKATVVVRCRRSRHGQVRTVLKRTTRLPRTLHVRVRCVASRPRAKLYVR
ncbi:MAG: hypothetical protein QOJ57_2588 [Thermoleophilaceae bacterium]|nr:hypothetical protein [Thermoleophilaceae bacterium]